MDDKHRGYSYSRVHQDNPCEKVFAEVWEKENVPARGTNGGFGILDALLIHCRGRRTPSTLEESRAVATVVQWLGSPIGWSFLSEVLEKCGYRLEKIEKR